MARDPNDPTALGLIEVDPANDPASLGLEEVRNSSDDPAALGLIEVDPSNDPALLGLEEVPSSAITEFGKGVGGSVYSSATVTPLGLGQLYYEGSVSLEKSRLSEIDRVIGGMERSRQKQQGVEEPPGVLDFILGSEQYGERAKAQRSAGWGDKEEKELQSLYAQRKQAEEQLAVASSDAEVWARATDAAQQRNQEMFGLDASATKLGKWSNVAGSALGSVAVAVGLPSGLGPLYLANQQGVDTYLNLRDKGMDPGEAAARAGVDTAVSMVFEKIGLDKIKTGAAGMNRAMRAMAGAAAESGTEVLQQGTSNLLREDPLGAYMAEAAVGGAFAGGVVSAVLPRGATPQQQSDQRTADMDWREDAANGLRRRLVDRYQVNDQEFLTAIDMLARRVQTPEQYNQLMEAITEGLQSKGIITTEFKPVSQPGATPTTAGEAPSGAQPNVPLSTPESATPVPVEIPAAGPLDAAGAVPAPAAADPVESKRQAVRQQVEMIQPMFPNMQIELVNNADELPNEIKGRLRRQNGGDGKVEGFWDPQTDRVFVVADDIAPERVPVVAMHELAGHRGVEAVLGPERMTGVYQQVYEFMSPEQRQAIVADGYAAEDTQTIAMEYIARLAENPDINPNLWQRVVADVRMMLRDAGYVGTVTDNDIRVLVYRGIREATRPAEVISPDNQMRLSRGPAWYYSQVEKTVGEAKQNKAPAGQWMAWLRSQPGIKQEELEWIGVDEWLKSQDKPVTKQELADFVAANKVEVQEVVLGQQELRLTPEDEQRLSYLTDLNAKQPLGAIDDVEQGSYQELMRLENIRDKSTTQSLQQQQKEFEKAAQRAQRSGNRAEANRMWERANHMTARLEALELQQAGLRDDTKFGQYKLPGGENYREVLLTLPEQKVAIPPHGRIERLVNGMYRVDAPGLQPRLFSTETEAIAETQRMGEIFNRNKAIKNDSANFRSSHFDTPNILAHVRMNERTDADGKRVLFIEEVQSDWHQQGREKGYKGAIPADMIEHTQSRLGRGLGGKMVWRIRGVYDPSVEFKTKQDAEKYFENTLQRNMVPDAPFKTSWPMLAMKRMIRWASENGFNRIAWTTGEQQAERYDLSKQVDRLLYTKNSDGTYKVSALTGNQGTMIGESIQESRLAEYVGKEVAQKMIKGVGERTEVQGKYDTESMTTGKEYMQSLAGVDLKVGGEGMKGFYDQILPAEVNKYVKKWGGKVGKSKMSAGDDGLYIMDAEDASLDPDASQEVVVRKRESLEAVAEPFNSLNEAEAWIDANEPDLFTVHSLDITPAMREAAMGRQILFSKPTKPKPSDINKNLSTVSPKLAEMLVEFVDQDRLSKLRVDTIASIKAVYDAFPTRKELAQLAEMGRAGRRWYQLANRVIRNLAQNEEDAWRLAGVLAATSPNKGVPDSVQITLGVWNAWTKAGRPQDPATLRKLLYRFWNVDNSMAPNKETAEIVLEKNPIYLPADLDNTIAALSQRDYASALQNFSDSSPKVKPFFRALMGELDAVVNDTWMARIFGLNKNKIGQVAENMLSTVMTKQVAKDLGWEPAEVQAGLWAVARVIGERINTALARVDNRPRLRDIFNQTVTDELLMPGDDLATLLVKGYKTKGGKNYDFSKQVADLGFNLERGLAEYNVAANELIERGAGYSPGEALGPAGIRSVGRRLEAGYLANRENVEPLRFSRGQRKSKLDALMDEMGVEPPPGKKMRGFSQRLALDPEAPGDAAKIVESAASYYKPQSISELRERINLRTDLELSERLDRLGQDPLRDGIDNDSILSAIELINRKHARGENTQELIDKVSKTGTALGQLIRQFAELKTKTPAALLDVIKRRMAAQDRYLRPQQEADLTGLINADFAARDALNGAIRAYEAAPNMPALENVQKLEVEAEKASRDMMQYAARMLPKKGANMFTQLIQGNLLVPISHMRNIGSNIQMQFIRDAEQAMAAAGDTLHSMINNSPRTISMPSITGRLRGLSRGVYQGFQEMATGAKPEERIHGEFNLRGFRPVEAWKSLLNPSRLPVNAEGKVSWNDYFKALVEGTLGIPAEINFRLLGLGDHPFRRSAYESVVSEQANLRGLKGADRARFIARPDAETIRLATEEALTSVYQNQGKFAGQLQGLMSLPSKIAGTLGEWVEAVLIRPFAPYVQTPLNVAHIGLQLASPEYSAARAIWFADKAHRAGTPEEQAQLRRKAYQSAARAVMASMLYAAGTALVRAGLVTGKPEEEEKLRNLQFRTMPPNSINVSGLKRWLNGGDPTWQQGDTVHNLFIYGFFGLNAMIAANSKRSAEREGKVWNDNLFLRAPPLAELGSTMVEMTVLKGSADVLDAISNGDYDNLERQYARTLITAALPNALAAANRANRMYLPDLKGLEQIDAMRAIVAERNPFINYNELYPYRRDPLGQPVRQTPQGVGSWMYQVFDPRKAQPTGRDAVWAEIGRIYNKTQDTAVIPALPQRTITINNVDQKLEPAQYDRMLQLVGAARMVRVQSLLNGAGWSKVSDARKVALLENAYRDGSIQGRKQYVAERANAGNLFAPSDLSQNQ